MFAQLASSESDDDMLAIRVEVDWEHNENLLGTTTEETITVIEPVTTTTASLSTNSTTETVTDTVTEIWITNTDSVTESTTVITDKIFNDQPISLNNAILETGTDRIALWMEDKLLNEFFQEFRWDFEWMVEEIPVESPKLPSATREFLATLCTNCFFLLKVSAHGPPHVAAVNESIVVRK